MPSSHPRAAAFIAAGLYRNLSSFRELEARIAALPEEIARGDAFEIFVEGYLRTMPVFQCTDLWLVGQVPLDVRRALNLPADAKGILAAIAEFERARCAERVRLGLQRVKAQGRRLRSPSRHRASRGRSENF